MKKFFEIIGFISLVLFSFFYTDKIKSVIKDNDDLLKTIKGIDFRIEPIDAVINDQSIIPGLSGREIDVDLSYQKMKKVGYFNDNLLVYKSIKPNISVFDNKDRYIEKGNPSKRMVGLVFKIKENTNIDDIISILNAKEIKATFFIDEVWFENNNAKIEYLISNNHIVGSLNSNNTTWMDTIVKRVFNQKDTYCYNEFTEGCNNSFIIKPLEIKNNLLLNVKNNLDSGYILSFDVNDRVEKELPIIIDYIKSRGLELVNLETLLQE